MRAEFADRLRLAGVTLDASFSPDPNLAANQRAHVSFDAHWWDWKLTGYYNYADFYDLFGPTKVSRKGESLKLAHSQFLIHDAPRTLAFDWSVAGYSDLDRLPEYQNVSTNVRDLFEANAALKYSNLARAQGAVDDEKGTSWGIYSRLYFSHTAFPRVWGNYDRGFLLPKNSSFWLRSSAGKSLGDFTSPFSNFYFGAFGNNYIDHGTIDFGIAQNTTVFPGVGIDAIGGRQLPAGSFDGRIQSARDPLPPLRRHVGLCQLGAAHLVFLRADDQFHQ